jgi:hypothetical protein
MRLGITGHRGLPPESERLVRQALEKTLQQEKCGSLTGVSCIADGPDSWFAESVLGIGGRLEVVVPAENYREELPEAHHATYDRLFSRTSEVHSTGFSAADSAAHMAGSEILVGLVEELIAVWDGNPARGYGGTADVVAYAERLGVPVRIVWPEGAHRNQ